MGPPARDAEGERESWAIVRLSRHLPDLTADELKERELLNPRPPVNEEREKEIDDFLNGPARKGRGGGARVLGNRSAQPASARSHGRRAERKGTAESEAAGE